MDRTSYIEDVLIKHMPRDAGPANPVRDAMEYALMAGGKRIRPRLMLLCYEAFQLKNPEKAVPREVLECYMAALEMIHTFSLIHDDLPALDDDSLRRGRPTVHVAFGEDIAILAGDGLENLAFEVAAKSFSLLPGNIRAERVMQILAGKPGLFGMLGGQTADVKLSGTPLTDEQLEYIYANKTSALLECAMMIGAVLGGADDEETDQIRKAAYNVGIAFQVQDDILDATGDAETLGKEVGQDARNEKTTFVSLHGLDAAGAYVQQKTDEAELLLTELFLGDNPPAAELSALLQGLVNRKA